MTIRLRSHHLLCLLAYVGKGYSPAFTANYDVIAGRISEGEDILVVEGPDDICAPLLNDADPHCWRKSVTARDRLAASALDDLLPDPIQTGGRIKLGAEVVQHMRRAFSANRIRVACLGCEWSNLCTTIAVDDYRGTRLHGAC